MNDLARARTRTSTKWEALLSDAPADAARDTIREIALRLDDPQDNCSTNPSLGSGDAGIALFHGYLFLAGHGERHRDLATRWLERALEAVADRPLPAALYGGFTGIAWVAQHLEAVAGIETAGELLDEIDEALFVTASNDPHQRLWTGEFDLISGMVGLGVYALERAPRKSATDFMHSLSQRLCQQAQHLDDGVAWWSDPANMPEIARKKVPSGCYNLGVAHGSPGVIALLAAMAAAGINHGEAHKMIGGAIAWLMTQQHDDEPGAEFPAWIEEGKARPGARTAWCYGNPGVACTLMSAADEIDEASWRAEALRLALNSAARPIDAAGTIDACLCHGAAGNGLMFHRLYQATSDPRLAEAARRWYGEVFKYKKPGRGLVGFTSWGMINEAGEAGWVDSAGFLEGIAGIGLGLLAATTPIDPVWDRLMLLSSARSRG